MPNGVPVIVRVPEEIDAKLQEEATSKNITAQAVILDALAKRFKLKTSPPKRGRPTKKS